MSFLDKFFGPSYEKEIKALTPLVEEINALESSNINLAEEELKVKTEGLRSRLSAGATLDDILVEAFEDLKADYVTLYDHPDKYQDFKDPRYVWGHGLVDIEENGIRKPGVIYNTGREDRIYISKSTHWRTVGSTTMTWATTGKNIKEDFEDLWKLHEGQPLPMGGTTFKMLAEKGKKLYSPITAYSTHAEEKWMSYFIDWRKESLC